MRACVGRYAFVPTASEAERRVLGSRRLSQGVLEGSNDGGVAGASSVYDVSSMQLIATSRGSVYPGGRNLEQLCLGGGMATCLSGFPQGVSLLSAPSMGASAMIAQGEWVLHSDTDTDSGTL